MHAVAKHAPPTRVLNRVFGEFLVKLRDLRHSVFD